MKTMLFRLRTSKSVRFVVLSGAGWCLDFVLFYVEVAWLDMPPAWANILSASMAAMTVFLASQWLVFNAQQASLRTITIYFAYTEFNIVIWAMAIAFISSLIHNAMVFPVPSTAIIAKVIVTPLSLASNFVVSRWLSKNRSYV